mmetsp:Transcript_11664/g.37031  ORF Transcript_11664/g.37031 Transcript_11664/m.37031 type:complete len:225 (-) Transcript_11664:1781-2455(-)
MDANGAMAVRAEVYASRIAGVGTMMPIDTGRSAALERGLLIVSDGPGSPRGSRSSTMLTVKRDPPVSMASKCASPRIRSASSLTIKRPRPVPPATVARFASTCSNSLNSCGLSRIGTPTPESSTSTVSVLLSPSHLTFTKMWPRSVNLHALLMRFIITCCTRLASPTSGSRSHAMPSCNWPMTSTPGEAILSVARRQSTKRARMQNGEGSRVTVPRLSFAASTT